MSIVRGNRLVVAAVALAALVSACSAGAGSEPTAATDAPPHFTSYVAMGDSYTAGPLIPLTDLASGCLRSNHDYPALVAQRLGIASFRDVSCSAADTGDLTGPQSTFQDTRVKPQLDALRRTTDLVTLGIGGNDFDLFSTLVRTCTQLRPSNPTGAPCTAELAGRTPSLASEIRRVGRRVATALHDIHRRAPKATVVLVGYLRLAPESGTCPRLLPLADGDYRLAVRFSRALDETLRSAARRGDAKYVDIYTASAGHDVCSAQPWVNGRHTIRDRALAYHPLAAGMYAVAGRVAQTLGVR
jgi:lysophospholipase L1-like esterase